MKPGLLSPREQRKSVLSDNLYTGSGAWDLLVNLREWRREKIQRFKRHTIPHRAGAFYFTDMSRYISIDEFGMRRADRNKHQYKYDRKKKHAYKPKHKTKLHYVQISIRRWKILNLHPLSSLPPRGTCFVSSQIAARCAPNRSSLGPPSFVNSWSSRGLPTNSSTWEK